MGETGRFSEIFDAARASGLLSHIVPRPYYDVTTPLVVDIERMRSVEDWCRDTFGPDAIMRINETDWDWFFTLSDGKWTHYGGFFYFTDVDDAVAFALRYSGE